MSSGNVTMFWLIIQYYTCIHNIYCYGCFQNECIAVYYSKYYHSSKHAFIRKQPMPARKIKRVEEDPNDKDDEMWNYYDVCKHYWIMDGWFWMEECLRHKCTLLKMPKGVSKYSNNVLFHSFAFSFFNKSYNQQHWVHCARLFCTNLSTN